MNDEIFTGLVAQLEDRFQEMDSGLSTALLETDATYTEIAEHRKELGKRFPFIESVLEGTGAVSLNAEEHAGLVEYLEITNEMENRERLNLYYAGHRDCFAYLRKIGVI